MGKATEGVKLDKITMPVEVVNEITQKIKERSFIAALVPSEPETFGSKEYVTWTEDPEGEFVGEGEAKSSSSFGMEPKEGKLHKFQVTVRMSDEVTWADEDNQLQILNALYGKMAEAKARGLDYGLGHAINPLTRTYIDGFKPESIVWNAKQVAATTDHVADFDNLADGIIEDYDVTASSPSRPAPSPPADWPPRPRASRPSSATGTSLSGASPATSRSR